MHLTADTWRPADAATRLDPAPTPEEFVRRVESLGLGSLAPYLAVTVPIDSELYRWVAARGVEVPGRSAFPSYRLVIGGVEVVMSPWRMG